LRGCDFCERQTSGERYFHSLGVVPRQLCTPASSQKSSFDRLRMAWASVARCEVIYGRHPITDHENLQTDFTAVGPGFGQRYDCSLSLWSVSVTTASESVSGSRRTWLFLSALVDQRRATSVCRRACPVLSYPDQASPAKHGSAVSVDKTCSTTASKIQQIRAHIQLLMMSCPISQHPSLQFRGCVLVVMAAAMPGTSTASTIITTIVRVHEP